MFAHPSMVASGVRGKQRKSLLSRDERARLRRRRRCFCSAPCRQGHEHRRGRGYEAGTTSPGGSCTHRPGGAGVRRGLRSEPVGGLALPRGRPVARRASHHRHRRAVAAGHLLHGHRRRGRVEDDRRRPQLGQHDRRADLGRRHGSGRGRGFGSERHLRRHRLVEDPKQHLDRPRPLQVDRRRQDLDLHGAARRRPDLGDPHQPGRSERAVRRRARRSVQADARARRLPQPRRRQDVETGAVPERSAWRCRPGDAARQPADAVRDDVEGTAQAVDDRLRRHRRRHLQVGRWRRPLDQARRRAADRPVRARQRRRQRRGAQPALCAHRGEAGAGALPLRRRRRALVPGERRRQADDPAVLLRYARRRSERRRHRVRRRRRLVQVDRRRQDLQAPARSAQRQPRRLDQPARFPAHDPGERRRRQRLARRRPDVEQPGEPADGRNLSGRGRRPVPLPAVRRAAGQHDGDRAVTAARRRAGLPRRPGAARPARSSPGWAPRTSSGAGARASSPG